MSRVLIIDDDRTWVELLSSRLRGEGFQVGVAYDAMQAKMVALKTPPDAIVLDIRMPGGNGVETLQKFRSSTKTAGLPIVIVSGQQDPDLEKSLRQAGADAYIPKPTTWMRVHKTLQILLKKVSPIPDA